MAQMRSLVESEFRSGAWNMAVDSAIVDSVASVSQPPTLRLYGWKPFCLSLGYGQRSRDVNLAALEALGWDLVRRPTGGKAILHGDELTYSLCLPLDHPMARGDVVESYRRISLGLLRAMELLGLSANAGHQGANISHGRAGPVCFELSSHYEITVNGRKLIGSAQLRRKGVLLQHGTLPLRGDLARICDVLYYSSEEERAIHKQSLRQRACTLEQVAGREVSWMDAGAAFEHCFAEAFNITISRGQLSACEAVKAADYQAEKFGNPGWTTRR